MNTKEEVRNLWRLCFTDSEAFVEMYFRLRYSDDINMTIRRDGCVVSALQLIPYPMTFLHTIIEASYISGACTHPDFRGKGVMAQLLVDTFTQMAQRHIPLSFLIPAEPGLYNYYARFGYAPAFFRTQITQDISNLTPLKGYVQVVHTTHLDDDTFDYFTRKAYACANYVQHTKIDFDAISEDLHLAEGGVWVAYKGNKIVGVLFAYPQDGSLKVNELFAEDKEVEEGLIYEAANYYKRSKIIRFGQPSHSKEEQLFGMARIIDAYDILKRYAASYPQEEMYISLTDPQLPVNDGYYHITEGKCIFSNKKQENNYTELTSQQLSTFLFDKVRLYMSLMLD